MVMAITLLGKVLGLFRDHLMAVHYGTTGMEAKAFYIASRIPRVFFDVVFASAIAACFIPVFSEYLTQRGKKEAFRFGSNFLSVMALLTAVLTVLGILFAQPLVTLFADGYDPQTAELAASLTRVMFPTVLFTGVAFSFVGILQAMDRFNIPALISTVSNLVIIGYFFFLDERFGVYGLAGAYLLGWLLQAVVQAPSLRQLDFRYRPDFSFRSEGMRKAFALMGPVMISTWVQPINLTINTKFGSRLYEGAGVSAMEYSTNLYLVIAGVFVLSVTNVIFPKLSRLTGREAVDLDQMIETTAGCSIPEIFQREGEPAFRKLETEALRSLEGERSLLVSCGGGIVETPENIDLMHAMGWCVYLDGDFDDSLRQIRRADTRPDFRSKRHAARLFEHRRPLYRAAADITVDIRGRSFTEVSYTCAEILLERGLL